MIETICGKIAEQILKVAINSVDSTCIYWHHQPQIPDAVRNLHKEVNTISEGNAPNRAATAARASSTASRTCLAQP